LATSIEVAARRGRRSWTRVVLRAGEEANGEVYIEESGEILVLAKEAANMGLDIEGHKIVLAEEAIEWE
jgi:hypothetical protein